MHLLHVIQRYYPFQGGSERYFQSLSERFVQLGCDVDVLTTDAWDLEYFWDPTLRRIADVVTQHNDVLIRRVPVAHLPWPRLTHRAIRRLMAESSRLPGASRAGVLRYGSTYGPWTPTLSAAMDAMRSIDVVHSANIAFESMIATAAHYSQRMGIPHLVTPFVHLGEHERSKVRRYYTMPHQIDLLRHADAVMTLTSIEAACLVQCGVPETRIHTVGAGIDVEAATGGDAQRGRERFGLDGPIVLSLGAAAFDKGTIHLADAVRRLNRSRETVTLVIAGPILGEFQRYWDEIAPVERSAIRLLGFVSDDEKRDLLAACDLVALPSRTESYGLVFPEAWANGKPVIGARAGAIPAVVEHGVDGLLVDFGDVNGLADAINCLAKDSTLRDTLAAAGRSKVVDEQIWFERVRNVYEQVLGGSMGGQREQEGTGRESILRI